MAEQVTDIELNKARQERRNCKKINSVIGPGLVSDATAPCIAPTLDAESAALESFRSNTMALTCIAGLAGLPQVSMPVLAVDDCPAGVSLVGAQGSDEQLLKLASYFATNTVI